MLRSFDEWLPLPLDHRISKSFEAKGVIRFNNGGRREVRIVGVDVRGFFRRVVEWAHNDRLAKKDVSC